MFLVLGVAAFPAKMYAQYLVELNLPDHDSKAVRFGINVGGNRSHYSFTHHPSFLAQDSIAYIESLNSSGINLSWLVNFNLNENGKAEGMKLKPISDVTDFSFDFADLDLQRTK